MKTKVSEASGPVLDWLVAKSHGFDVYHSEPLIAAMRCYCMSRLGETVEVPDELA